MRISDWSSDVCSSDLPPRVGGRSPDLRHFVGCPRRLKLCLPIAKDAPMAHWYFSSGSNSPRVGPPDDNAAHAHAQQHPEDLCWRDGMAAWKPVGDVPELAPSAARNSVR